MKKIILFLFKAYKVLVSPVLPPACGYHPTCSAYAGEAVEKHGVFKGAWMAMKRISRCTPFHRGGYDPVP